MDMQSRSGSVLGVHKGGWHRVAYGEWGDPANPRIVVCVHGLTRNRRDFDELARALAPERRVVCMDVAGRGDSDWMQDKAAYGFPLYEADAAALIARVTAGAPDGGTVAVDWVGTSMGGLLGMVLAARAGSPIRRLVLNDIGPYVASAALERIRRSHAQTPAEFASLESVEQQMRITYATFGALDDAQWRRLAERGSRKTDRGTYVLACDPAVAGEAGKEAADAVPPPLDLWRTWDRIRCPTFVVRGAQSDVLTRETAQAMQARGPRAREVEFEGVGHAPWLMSTEQIAPVREFLLAV